MVHLKSVWQILASSFIAKAALTAIWLLCSAGLTAAVLIDQQSGGCGGSFSGKAGNFTSPGYPNKYAENLRCLWNITVDNKSRIHFDFIYVEIEAGDGCLYDYLLFRDGLSPTSPALAKICHGHSTTIKSTGSSASALFVSDSTIGSKGFHLAWRAVPKVSLLVPDGMSITSPWRGMTTPKNLKQMDSGITESLWVVDNKSNVYLYVNGNWDLVQGRMATVSAGACVIATSEDGFVWYRQGVSVLNPKGNRWLKTDISVPMSRVECGREGIAVGIDNTGSIYQLEVNQNGPTGLIWKLLDAIPTDKFVDVSCGSYACWFVTTRGDVYISQDIDVSYSVGSQNHLLIRKVPSPPNIKQIAAGFAGTLWAISSTNNVYTRTEVSILRPGGAQWKKVDRTSFTMITAGLRGIYGFTKSGIIVTKEDERCGNIFTAKTGMFATPNYPSIYPANLTCLWVIKVPDATAVVVQFMKFISIGTMADCFDDYLVSFENGKYSSKFNPIIECGDVIDNKYFAGNEVWIEFNSGKLGQGYGFQAFYDAWSETDNTKITKGVETVTDPSIRPLSEAARINTFTAASTVGSEQKMVTTAESLGTQDTTAVERNTKITSILSVTKSTSRGAGTTAEGNMLKASKIATTTKTATTSTFISTEADKMNQSTTIESKESKPRMNERLFVTATTRESRKNKPSVNGTLFATSSTRESRKSKPRMDGTLFATSSTRESRKSEPRMNGTLFATASTRESRKSKPSVNGTLFATSSIRESRKSKPRMNGTLFAIASTRESRKSKSSVNGTPFATACTYGTTTKESERSKDNTVSKDRITEKKMTESTASIGGLDTVTTTPISIENATKEDSMNRTMATEIVQQLTTPNNESHKEQFAATSSTASTTMDSKKMLTDMDSINGGFTTMKVDKITTVGGSERTRKMTSKSSRARMASDDSMVIVTAGASKGSLTTTSSKYFSTDMASWKHAPTTEKVSRLMTVKSSKREMPEGMRSSNENITPEAATKVTTKDDSRNSLSTMMSITGKFEVSSTQKVPKTERLNMLETLNGKEETTTTRSKTRKEEITLDPNMTIMTIADKSDENTPSIATIASTYNNEGLSTSYGISKKKILSSTSSMDAGLHSDSKPLPSRSISTRSLFSDENKTTASNYTPTFGATTGTPKTTSKVPMQAKKSTLGSQSEKGQRTTGFNAMKASTLEPSHSVSQERPPAPMTILPQVTAFSDWELVNSSKRMSKVSVSIGDHVWALDKEGKAYVLFEERWIPIGNERYRSIATGLSSVWAVKQIGSVLYRLGVTDQLPVGHSWIQVNSPLDFEKITVGTDNDVFAIHSDGSLFVRLGISSDYPFGRVWHNTRFRVMDIAISSFGVFAVNMDNSMSYAEIKSRNETSLVFSKWIRISAFLRNISAGHGSSLWGLQPDGTLLQRKGVEGTLPFGDKWMVMDGKTISISPGLFRVYRVLADGKVVRKKDNVCGGLLSSKHGRIMSPNYPGDYDTNLNCLWKVSIPGALQFTIKANDFNLEEDPLCLNDRILVFEVSKEPYSECGTRFKNKTIHGDTFMVEFVTNDKLNARGFDIMYASMSQGDLKRFVTATPVRSEAKENYQKITAPMSKAGKMCEFSCTTKFKPVCGSNGKTYENECLLKVDACNLDVSISVSKNSSCEDSDDIHGWEPVPSYTRISIVAANRRGSLWALDPSGTPLVRTDETWERVGSQQFKTISVGERGVWGVKFEGSLRYRQGVTKWNPQGTMWLDIDGLDFNKVVIGPFNRIIAIRNGNRLVSRTGTSVDFPIGTGWMETGKSVMDASIGEYGLWVVNSFGLLQFAPLSIDDDLSSVVFQWINIGNGMRTIHVGHGGTLWGIQNNGTLMQREGVTMENPTGMKWKQLNGVTTSFTSSALTIYRTLASGTIWKRKENACGGMLYSMMGTFTTPNYPSLYPRNTRCLWILKVPFAKGVKLQYDDFDLEESSECRADWVIIRGPKSFQATKNCGVNGKGKVIRGNVAMIEFMSNGVMEKRGFKARYESLFLFEDNTNHVFQTTMEVTRRQAATNPEGYKSYV